MVQAHASELLNQKESPKVSSARQERQNPLQTATGRLAAALDRLEDSLKYATAGKSRDARQHEQLVVFERENGELRQEQEHLSSTVHELQGQYDDLHKAASTIHKKLEDSIKRLTQIIEN